MVCVFQKAFLLYVLGSLLTSKTYLKAHCEQADLFTFFPSWLLALHHLNLSHVLVLALQVHPQVALAGFPISYELPPSPLQVLPLSARVVLQRAQCGVWLQWVHMHVAFVLCAKSRALPSMWLAIVCVQLAHFRVGFPALHKHKKEEGNINNNAITMSNTHILWLYTYSTLAYHSTTCNSTMLSNICVHNDTCIHASHPYKLIVFSHMHISRTHKQHQQISPTYVP